MRRLFKQWAPPLCMVALLLESEAPAAEIGVDIKASGSFTITVSGEITAGDDLVFARFLKLPGHLWVDLDSPGGDVDAALAIGRLVRKREGTVNVKGNCYSACVLIFAGGVTRLDLNGMFSGAEDPQSRVGVHRLYFADLSPGLSQAQVKADYDAKLHKIKNYLREMDVAPEFLSYMQSIEPEQMHLMTSSELDRYGLGSSDVVYNERMIANQAAVLGITSAEYRQRQKRSVDAATGANSECKDLASEPSHAERSDAASLQARGVPATAEQMMRVNCALAIRYGISLDVYRDRSARVAKECKQLTDTEQNSRCGEHFLATGRVLP